MRRALAMALVLVVPALGPAADPVCALLDADKSPRAALLEAKLLAEPGARWVERAAIDKVLREQKLAAAFGAQGVKERLHLGKLLKADVLVIVRRVKTPDGVSDEIVVSETAGGLRLLVRGVPATVDGVAALVAAAREGIRKYGEEVKLIVAAPPFVSNDLSNRLDHLKGAYAKLAEAAAFDRKGAVVVEFAEAEALAKELALAAPGANVTRPAPLYLIGEYRHDGAGPGRTVTLKLRAERAGRPVGKGETVVVSAGDGPAALRKWAAGVLDAAGGALPLPDPKAEVKRLNELTQVHRRLGNWVEALALVEASLLLDPNQPDLNAAAIDVLMAWIPMYYGMWQTDANRTRQAVRAHRRGLEHLDALATARAKQPSGAPPIALRVFASGAVSRFGSPSELTAEQAELHREHSDLYERLLILLAPRADQLAEMRYFQEALLADRASAADKCARMERMFLVLRALPDAKQRFVNHLLNGKLNPATAAELEALWRLLDRLADGATAEVKGVLEMARGELMGRERGLGQLASHQLVVLIAQSGECVAAGISRAAISARQPKGGPMDPPPGGPLTPIRLSANLAADDESLKSIQGILAAGPGVDVLWSGKGADGSGANWGTVFVMKEKGKLRLCYRIKGLKVRFAAVVYDGRFVWGSASRNGVPVFFVLDPATETVYEFGERDGLPLPKAEPEDRNPARNKQLPAPLMTVLGPGRVCVSGNAGRGWVGVATFQPEKGGRVEVIHEAKEARVPKDAAQWKAGAVVFRPSFMCTLRGEPGADGKVPTRVLIMRSTTQPAPANEPEMLEYPLLVDPDTKAVEVGGPFARWYSHPLAVTDRSAYWLRGMWDGNVGEKRPCRVFEIDVGGKAREVGPAPECRSARPVVHFDGQRVHVVRSHPPSPPREHAEPATWWVMSPDGKTFREVATAFPHVVRVCTSSHYDLVAVVQPRFGERELRAVKLDLPAENK